MAHWESEYRALASELLAGPLALEVILGELERIESVAGAAIGTAGGDAASIASGLESWWTERHGVASGQL